MVKSIATKAFAKIILSGEHAVVYNHSALALSVDRYVTTNLISLPSDKNYTFISEKLGVAETISKQHLHAIGHYKILQKPIQLLQYTLIKLIEYFDLKITSGLKINTTANIPISCGLGSSSALIISLMHAVNHFFALNFKIADYLKVAMDIENIQHGRSSGLDLYLAMYGGGVKFENGNVMSRDIANMSIYFVNSGKSVSSTMECVNSVAKYFINSSLANDFEKITNALDNSLQQRDLIAIKEIIRINHKLLNYIGVVPKKVQHFINDIEYRNGAAKICGAGAMNGDAGGIIMVIGDRDIDDLLVKYGYELLPLKGNSYGVQVI